MFTGFEEDKGRYGKNHLQSGSYRTNMKLTFALPNDEQKIKGLLTAGDLHHEDIEPGRLKHFLLAWDATRLIGVVGLEIQEGCALLRSLTVDADYRNKGIASRMVDKIENHAVALKLGTLYLLTMTAESFFAKRGYQLTTRDSAPAGIQATSEFQSLCPASAACMVKHLGGE